MSAILLSLILGAQPPAAETPPPPPLEEVRDITYVQWGADTLEADVYMPAGAGPFPGVLMVHGGAWVSGGKWQMTGHARRLARAGYTVMTINYRLAPRHKFPAQIEDCRAAVRWMRENADTYRIDAERIAGFGYSAGGHLVCLLGAASFGEVDADSPALQAVIAGGAPCDFEYLPPDNRVFEFLFGATRGEVPDRYRDASPLAFASSDDPPTLFIHGERDLMVPRFTAEQMFRRLQQADVRAEMKVIENKGHVATFFDPDLSREAIRFLDDVLEDGRREASADTSGE